MKEDPDAIMIHRYLSSGDEHLFEPIVDKYKDNVYNYCFRFLGDEDEAADCAQEIFIRIFKGIGNFRFQSRFSSWLFRIMVNCCKDASRKKQYTMRLFSSADTEPGVKIMESGHHTPDPRFDPEKALVQKERDHFFGLALQRLGTAHRTMVILRDIEGRSYEEIGKITRMKPGTVRSSLARARFRLAELLKNYRHELQEI